jgi:uncharacterized protein (UPF0216 family)
VSPDSVYERVLQRCLKGELKIVNSGLPRRRKPLSTLLGEKYPCVECNDGTLYLFKRKELICLASILSTDEQDSLLLPMLIEVETNQPQAAAICGGNVEEKVLSKITGMTLTYRDGKFRLYRPQLALIRRELKTTTQYVFSPSIL